MAADSLETPLAGVTVTMLGLNGGGGQTGCTGATVSDAAGNFALTNLPAQCVGPQLIGYGGANVTSPAGNYAGVNLIYTLVASQVVVSPVLVHLPRLNNAETMMVQQNSPVTQVFTYATIPGVTVTRLRGNHFHHGGRHHAEPVPATGGFPTCRPSPRRNAGNHAGVIAFIVAFQPANSVASQAIAVSYPNTLNTAPGTSMPLMTLNPTLGRMVPYGTAPSRRTVLKSSRTSTLPPVHFSTATES